MRSINNLKLTVCIILSIIVSFWFPAFPDSIPGIKLVKQEKSMWCWAGVCECLIKYWDRSCTKTQTQIASVLTSQNTAPNPDDLPKCLLENGKPVNLQVTYLKTTIPWAEVKKEADEKRPFYFFIRWNSGGYHSNVFSGYINDSTKLKFMDPGGGSWVYRTWEGLSNVNNKGKWERTYKTLAANTNVINSFSFKQVHDNFRIVQNTMQQSGRGVTFIFNDNSNDSRMLRIYNTFGRCIYESVIDRTMPQLTLGSSGSLPAGRYYVLYGIDNTGNSIGKNSFYIVK